MNERKISVIIPTLNSSRTLPKCLASIRENKTKYHYEIIIVDAGSIDETLDIAEREADKVLLEHTYPPKINRNSGVENAKGEIVCFTDSDCFVPDSWLDTLIDGLLRLHGRDKRIISVGTGNVPWLEHPSLMELAISRTMRSPFVAFRARNVATYNDEREVSHNPAMSSAYFKWAFNEVGGFNEKYGYGYGEDVELDTKLIRKGFKLYYLPEGLVYHKHRATLKQFVKQAHAYGRARIKIGRKFKECIQFHHYGPLFLCLMTFSPLLFIPLAIALVNSAWVSIQGKNPSLFFPLVLLTMIFHVGYGWGEIVEMVRGEKP